MDDFQTFIERTKNFSYTQYCQTGAMEYASVMILHLGVFVWLLSIITKDYSWIDRIWSLLPIGFALHLLYHQVNCQFIAISLRQWIMLGLITIWGLRLTYNFFRKGGYTLAGEDYRWAYIRQRYPRILVQILNFVFTSFYQVFLIFWFSCPIRYAHNPQFTLIDIGITAIWIFIFCGQVIADQQQWDFQTEKYRLLKLNGNQISKLPKPYNNGFLKQGLFSYSRHPNFFCQITLWYIIYLFSVSSHGLNWSGIGAILLNLLFLGSTPLTEIISTQKYPHYKQYQKQVSMLIPGRNLKNAKKTN